MVKFNKLSSRSYLLYEARKLKRNRKIANTWTADGKVFIKETVGGIPINVKDNEDLATYSSAKYIDQPENEPTPTTSNECPVTSNEFQQLWCEAMFEGMKSFTYT